MLQPDLAEGDEGINQEILTLKEKLYQEVATDAFSGSLKSLHRYAFLSLPILFPWEELFYLEEIVFFSFACPPCPYLSSFRIMLFYIVLPDYLIGWEKEGEYGAN